jgi:hypothetical protein
MTSGPTVAVIITSLQMLILEKTVANDDQFRQDFVKIEASRSERTPKP